jgi:hypothetical protein
LGHDLELAADAGAETVGRIGGGVRLNRIGNRVGLDGKLGSNPSA